MEHEPISPQQDEGQSRSPKSGEGRNSDTAAPKHPLLAYLRALRPHQWTKNSLLVLPAALVGELSAETFFAVLLPAIIAFCLLASGVYVVNDLLDLENDRAHPRKCMRPFAAGDIPVRHGYWMAPLLFLSGLSMAALLGPATLLLAVSYIVLTTAYSFWLKHLFLLDVCTLSGLYTLRVAAGAAAAGIPLSGWLAAFSLALFFSLASVKRLVELAEAPAGARAAGSGHGYFGRNRALVERLAIGSGVVAILILTVYLSVAPSVALFDGFLAKLAVSFVFAGWLGRIIVVARRGGFRDDPIMFALTDWFSWVCLAAIGLLAVFA